MELKNDYPITYSILLGLYLIFHYLNNKVVKILFLMTIVFFVWRKLRGGENEFIDGMEVPPDGGNYSLEI